MMLDISYASGQLRFLICVRQYATGGYYYLIRFTVCHRPTMMSMFPCLNPRNILCHQRVRGGLRHPDIHSHHQYIHVAGEDANVDVGGKCQQTAREIQTSIRVSVLSIS